MLTFDEAKHEYRWNGVKVPGVNEILKASGIVNFDHIPIDRREAGMHFGKVIHTACELYDRGTLDIDLLIKNDANSEYKVMPYLNGWKKFRRDYSITRNKIKSIENKHYSKQYNFAGRHDRVIIINDYTMLDIKLYIDSKMGGDLQTAGYSILWDENFPKFRIRQRIVVRLVPNDYGITVYRNKSDRFDFLVCLQMYNLKVKRNLL